MDRRTVLTSIAAGGAILLLPTGEGRREYVHIHVRVSTEQGEESLGPMTECIRDAFASVLEHDRVSGLDLENPVKVELLEESGSPWLGMDGEMEIPTRHLVLKGTNRSLSPERFRVFRRAVDLRLFGHAAGSYDPPAGEDEHEYRARWSSMRAESREPNLRMLGLVQVHVPVIMRG